MSLTAELVTLLCEMKEAGEIDQATYDAVYRWGTTQASGEIFSNDARPEPEHEEESPQSEPAEDCPLCGKPSQTHSHTIEGKKTFIFVPRGIAGDDYGNHISIFEDDPDRVEKMRELLADGASIRTWAEDTFVDGKRDSSFIW